jgi:hypothetical protein
MRMITDHIANPVNDQIKIAVTDEPGAGGANHAYEVSWPGGPITHIEFQNGPINEVGVNGLTQEALLAIVIDRLRSFQAGPFACKENAEALEHSLQALEWLKSRTKARIARGVEGTMQK